MNDFTDRLHAAADYIDKHDVPKLLSAGVDSYVVDFHGTTSSPDRLGMFLRWADTLGGDVALTAIAHGKGAHLHARGMLPGTEYAANLVVVVNSATYPTLAEVVGDAEDEVPVTREQLEQVAAGRGCLAPELLAEVKHWSETPFAHESDRDGAE